MKYQNKLQNGKTQCLICPRKCTLNEGQKGFCKTRKNIDGNIILTVFGYNTGFMVDPVEKKPLYHFYPASSILSFGTTGCTMGCLFCQNHTTSKANLPASSLNKTDPKQIVEIAKKYNINSVAFTYNDPIAFFEYAIETAKLCKQENIKTVAVTSGFMNMEPAKEFFQYMDGANIDLKGFSETFYSKNCLAKLKPVLDVIKYVKNETNCHLELTTMLIEGENDTDDMIKSEAEWVLNNLGDTTPIHFSAFFPRYKFINRKQTELKTLLSARKVFLDEGVKYVYTGNLSNLETSTTFCKKCKKPLIIRSGYKVEEINLKDGHCKYCDEVLDGKFLLH